MCLYPKTIENRKYRANKKNGGIIPPVNDNRIKWVQRNCGECIECRKQKARAWQVRLLEDIKTNTNGKFITLTFSNQSIAHLNTKNIIKYKYDKDNKRIKDKNGKPVISAIIPIHKLTGYDKDNAIATIAIRLFTERWRKKYKKSVRHWMITEIGHKGTENIHLHGIIWTNQTGEEIENIWKYGFVWKGHKKNGKIINYVNTQTVTYITKYLHKIDLIHKTFKGKVLTSAGIGNTYNGKYNKYNGTETNELYRTSTGHTMTMPAYWRNKIYTQEQREKLWIQKLDKGETWICGEKIEKNNKKKYDALLEYHRTRNMELGYGTNNKNQKRAKYERERRKILQETRLKNATINTNNGFAGK